MKRILLAALLILDLLTQISAGAERKKPKLLLAIVIDQFRYDYLTRFEDQYNAGLKRMLDRGAVFTDAHYIHFPTVTAIGHSTFMSGATPSISGIVGNEWYDRETKRNVTSVSDESVQLLGGVPGERGSSPHRLLVSTIPDELKMAGKAAKVVSVSIKDRSAILPVGHMADGAYWFDNDSNSWVSSTYYMADLPGWVKEINRNQPASKYLGQEWLPLDAKPGAKPFCTMVNGSDVPYCGAIEATPWGNEMIESFAEQAVAAEQLGRHAGTDVLSVSLSSNDYVGHRVGPDAPEVRDISIRTDRLLGKLLDYLDSQVGAGNTLLVLTADHGVAPVPEVNQQRKMPGGRLNAATLLDALNKALNNSFGEGKWVESGSGEAIYLNRELIRNHKLNLADFERVGAEALRSIPHIARVYTGEQLRAGQILNDAESRAVSNGFYPQRSGDLLVVPEPYYMFSAQPGTTHGTPFNYDSHVPVIFLGAGIKPGRYHQRIAVNDVAPTLAAMLDVEEPSGAMGRILSEIFE
jgi:predicted AlkP superfamily pyrophosphatase or phosphodiesterase